MKCKKVRDVIMYYIDGELSKSQHLEIAEHLQGCQGCKEHEESLRRTVIEPFRKAKKSDVPGVVWHRIKESLVSKKERRLLLQPRFNWIGFIRRRKAVLVPVTIILLIGAILFGRETISKNTINAYFDEQLQFLSVLGENGEEPYFAMEDVNLDTSIESYFL